VVAETRAIAEDAAAMASVEVDELEPVMGVASGSPIHTITKQAGGELAEAEKNASVSVEATFRLGRNTSMPMETRGLVASPEPDGGVTLYGVAKLPAFVRAAIADLLEVPVTAVRLAPVAVGGGFGVRGELYPEDLLTVIAAVRTARSVAWIEDRSEHLTSINHARESTWHVRVAAAESGEIVALSGIVDIDAGAYLRTLVPAELDASELFGPYRIPAYRCEARVWLTNKMGIGTMRAPGTFESTFVREMLFERLAAALHMPALEVRRRNLLQPGDLPLALGFDLLESAAVYDSADLPEAFRLADDAIHKDEAAARSRATGAGKRFGISVVPVILPTGIGPFESARLVVEPPGILSVHVATTSMGQGHSTSLAQVAADAVGVPIDVITVHEGDPAAVPASIGTFASRSMVAAGNAVWAAGLQLREQLLELLEDRPVDLVRALEIAGQALEATARFDIPTLTYSYGAHAVQVEVDPELGTVELLRYVVVADAGRVVNPVIASDQIRGGAVFGIGGALFESIEYSAEGQLLTSTFLDFLLPSVGEAPAIEVTLVDRARSPLNPLGIKGVGEIGTAAAGAVIAAAVQDAIGHEGGWLDELPLVPEKVRALIE
jgi:carbon-monoxide dehydrogenase large subunit